MYVDPRVARARAQIQLSERSIDPETIRLPICRTIHRGLLAISKRGMTKRAMVRHLEGYVLPALRKIGVSAWLCEEDGRVCVRAAKVLCDTEHGLRGLMYSSGHAAAGRVHTLTWFTITPHAIARCLQRNGVIKLAEILDELHVAAGLADKMVSLCALTGWTQAFVPTRRGIFVGEIDRQHGLVMRTYFQPGANGRESKWTELLDALPSFELAGATFDLEAYRKLLFTWVEQNALEMKARFPFMQRPYENADDPTDAVWSAAREAAERKAA